MNTYIAHYAEIYRTEPGRRRECLYYLALGHYKMDNYEEAERFNCAYLLTYAHLPSIDSCLVTALLLEKEPANLQAQSLASLIEKKVTRGALCHLLFPRHEP